MSFALILGYLLDTLLGEPKRWHPLVGFGRWAAMLEANLNVDGATTAVQRGGGVLAWVLAVVPAVAVSMWLCLHLGWWVDAVLLFLALGARSLGEHARAVMQPLAAGDLDAARSALSRMVSRDTTTLDESGVAAATIESVLENGNDAVFGTLFWFALLGGPGAVLFRLANTLDAMWGYRTPRYLHFGWAAARIDDVLAYVPARLTAFSYALFGRFTEAINCWRTQAPLHDSPNAGPVMAAGAGALGLRVGGAATYHGQHEERPVFGIGAAPHAGDIWRAVLLVRRTTWLWCAALVLLLWLAERLYG
ncbi:adenosylcobinamide-phosphate synthase CbiB [Uliginosibacterium sp. H1]|uniref:adenosylcobinamide-phosphate synthase CbiB n=1 Tax=Uliginosibacterium sp. H1 TaxID=3114757 RepID=UPI002E19FB59|nr:adenosylcobinamide-phosphate synthase CbiB [Uliginosibacterium sp. H1]